MCMIIFILFNYTLGTHHYRYCYAQVLLIVCTICGLYMLASQNVNDWNIYSPASMAVRQFTQLSTLMLAVTICLLKTGDR